MHGFADKGRGLLLVAVDPKCRAGLTGYLPAHEVEHIPEMIRCLVPMRHYHPDREVVVAFTHGGGKIETCVVVERELVRPDAGQDMDAE
jgi:hypothetical protein